MNTPISEIRDILGVMTDALEEAERHWHDVVTVDGPTRKDDLCNLAIELWEVQNTLKSLELSVAARINSFLVREPLVRADGWTFKKGYPTSKTTWDDQGVLRALAEDFAAMIDEGISPAQAVEDTYLAVLPHTSSTGFKRTGLKALGRTPDFYATEDVVDPVGRAKVYPPKPRPLADEEEADGV